jgi:hypothetical protein
VVFLLTLPLDVVVSFLQNSIRLNLDTASKTAESIRNVGLLLLILASATRYYGAVSEERVSKRFRLYSLQLLVMAWDSVLLILIINVSLNVLLAIGPINFPIAGVILFIAYYLMIRFEKKALNFYALKGFIYKKDVAPYVSRAFLILTAGFNFAISVEFFAMILGIGFSGERFVLIWVLPLLIISSCQIILERIKKSKKR